MIYKYIVIYDNENKYQPVDAHFQTPSFPKSFPEVQYPSRENLPMCVTKNILYSHKNSAKIGNIH